MGAGSRLHKALLDAGLAHHAGALAKNEVNDVATLEALTDEDLAAIVGEGNTDDIAKLRALPRAGAVGRLHRALKDYGLQRYIDVLERNEIHDVATLESLSDDDWASMLGAGRLNDKRRFDVIISLLRPSSARRGSAATPARRGTASRTAEGWHAPTDAGRAADEFSTYTTAASAGATEGVGHAYDPPPGKADPPVAPRKDTSSDRKHRKRRARTGKKASPETTEKETPRGASRSMSPPPPATGDGAEHADAANANARTYKGRKVTVENRPPWRAPGCPQSAGSVHRARGGWFSPLEDLIFTEKRRILWRKLNEILTDPQATKMEKEWARAVGGSAAQGNPTAADLQASAVGGKYTGPTNLTGSKWLLKPQDTVRVLEPSKRLHRAMGSIQAKSFPHTPLMCGKVGTVVSLQDVVVVKFAESPQGTTLKVPPEALELIATKHVREQQLEDHVTERYQDYLNDLRAARAGGVPEAGAEEAPEGRAPPAREPEMSAGASASTRAGAGSPPTPPAPEAEPSGAYAPQQPPNNPRYATHRKQLEERLDALQADLNDARDELAEAQAKNHRNETVQAELKDLLVTFTDIARTMSTSSTWWAQQLAAAHPQSAALAAEVSNANTRLTRRLEDLGEQLHLP